MSQHVVHRVTLSLPVLFLKEKRTYIAYSPALDLSASGTTVARATKNFEITLDLFLDELMKAGTLESVFKDLGWSKQEKQWQPPVELQKVVQVPFRVPVAA